MQKCFLLLIPCKELKRWKSASILPHNPRKSLANTIPTTSMRCQTSRIQLTCTLACNKVPKRVRHPSLLIYVVTTQNSLPDFFGPALFHQSRLSYFFYDESITFFDSSLSLFFFWICILPSYYSPINVRLCISIIYSNHFSSPISPIQKIEILWNFKQKTKKKTLENDDNEKKTIYKLKIEDLTGD